MKRTLSILILNVSLCSFCQSQVISQYQTEFYQQDRYTQLLNGRPGTRSFCRMHNLSDSTPKKANELRINSSFGLSTEFNSKFPFNSLNGIMIPARGIQSVFSTALNVRYRHIQMQIEPNLHRAENLPLEPYSSEGSRFIYLWWNTIDTPDFSSTDPIDFFSLQNSYLKWSFDKVQFGVSNQHLWWGPGKYQSIILSTNAAGFPHLSLESKVPISTKIGTLDFQLISGILKNSGIRADTTRQHFQTQLEVPRFDDDRILNGLTFTFQPKGLEGLFFGFAHTSQSYLSSYFSNREIKFQSSQQDQPLVDFRSSIFFRWAGTFGEFYGEYARNNSQFSLANRINRPEEDMAFLIGFSRLFDLDSKGNLFFDLELVRLQQNPDYIITSQAKSWYTHPFIRQGYTHKGQILGSNLGPGGNTQIVKFGWLNRNNRLALVAERYVRNNDFYYYFHSQTGDWRSYWVDYTIGLESRVEIKKFLFQVDYRFSNSLNYQWTVLTNDYWTEYYDKTNHHFSLGIYYRILSL